MSRPPRQTDQRYRKDEGLGKRAHRRKQARQCFAGRRMDARCQMEEELGKKGHVLFSSAREACLSVRRRGPRAGEGRNTAQVQAHTRCGTKVQCPIPPVELQTRVPFSSLFSEGSVSTSTSHPSSSSPPTNQPPFAPSPLIPSRRHCDLLKLNPTRAATRGEGSRPDMEERGQERCGM